MTRIIHWFRQDLRLADNPALTVAMNKGEVIPIYILDDVSADQNAMGAASRIRLHKSLLSLKISLKGQLHVFNGDAAKIIPELISLWGVDAVYWNRLYESWIMQRDQAIKEYLKARAVDVQSFSASVLWEPWTINKPDKTPYKVFTPFFRRGCANAPAPREPLPAATNINFAPFEIENDVDSLNLVPNLPWAQNFLSDAICGEDASRNRLLNFVAKGLEGYKKGRDLPAANHVSGLSAALHFGEISPNQAYYAAQSCESENDVDHFHSELAWREFSISVLFHHPNLRQQNFNPAFDHFPWRQKHPKLQAWQMGQTGYPIIDAGMRELYQTGYMHNRVRMIVASFLVKNMLVHWRVGESWFWDTLIDADHASNAASWQWVAGSGADGAPYFRVFNPVLQGNKFDPDGEYTLRYVPELKGLDKKHLHSPWLADKSILREAGIMLGVDYPEPIIALDQSRKMALEAFEMMKAANAEQ